MECVYCKTGAPDVVCADCKCTAYCDAVCAELHWNAGHAEQCQRIGPWMLPAPARDTSYRQRGFYNSSVAKLKWMPYHDMFTWLCFQSYKTGPLINFILFKVNGDFSKLDHTFNGVYNSHYYRSRNGPSSPGFDVFFSYTLHHAAEKGIPLLNPKTRQPVLTEQQLIQAFPSVAKPLSIRDPAAFVKHVVWSMQRAIMYNSSLSKPLVTWRGYTPLNLPGTLAVNISEMHIGQRIVNYAFTSVSLDDRVSAGYVDHKRAKCCMARVTLMPGMPAFLIDGDRGDPNFPVDLMTYHQQEILLPVGTIFKVTKISNKLRQFSTNWHQEPVFTSVVYMHAIGVDKKFQLQKEKKKKRK